ncbi:hypothetical protein P344_02115 [Spiroplasma mirum ATCC 29335]|uniref:Uncharacterized protein n=1 Tax=Spiroplasma mirum ATCC 29335 TaxID=838561 RepID=W0GQI7_9MOLU|nr:transposase [Spiroplasma mirum ATCC 29335]AHI57771.1 hypothetical protein P344_02115 [Spiroplasma mirum ATCC 29335]
MEFTGVVDQEISKMLALFIENDLLLVEVNTVKREIKRFKNIQDYKQKRKKCIKKLTEFTKKKLDFIKIRFNKYHDTSE